ncbi:MAG: hypothetical protein RLZZ450_7044 [Pseudomonadota bacterium]
MARRKQAEEQTHVTVWPSSFPEDVGSDDSHGGGQSLDSDELGSHFLTDAVEHSRSAPPHWEDETDDEPYFDAKMGADLLRSFGLKPMPKRTTTRPRPPETYKVSKLAALRVPRDFEELIGREGDVDLTDETIREGSLLDREGEELGEVEAPTLNTEDVHTHGKRRGGHPRTSLRPPRMRRDGE